MKNKTLLPFDEWYKENEDELYINKMEQGLYYELDFDHERYIEQEYDKYCQEHH